MSNYSGASFDRPSWKNLIKEIKDGKVSTAIIKDMSRVGRDYLQVSFYTEVMFREKGVHFIEFKGRYTGQQMKYINECGN